MSPTDSPPTSLNADRSFWGMLVTQFLGAFNDNLFKQLVLLVCLDYALATGDDWQFVAQAMFAVPFMLLSGFAGWVSDRWPKRGLIVGCKAAEIAVMLLGAAAFWIGGQDLSTLLLLLFGVLALMSAQSAFFGPPKYGILPELFADRDLPKANGLIQMTTFLSIIFGTALAGILKDQLAGRLWIISAGCVAIAVLGTLTSLAIRRTPVAEPDSRFTPSALFVHHSLWETLRKDRLLLQVLFVSSLFWLVGGLVPLAVNAFGKVQLGFSDTGTSVLLSCTGFGIAAGCVLAGRLSGGRVRYGLVVVGTWGIVASFVALVAVGWFNPPPAAIADAAEPAAGAGFGEAPAAIDFWKTGVWWIAALPMTTLGVFSGLFAVPLQVALQTRPPRDLKGRMIGAMNLFNWVGIVLSSAVYFGLTATVAADGSYHWAFAVAAVLLIPVGLFFHPSEEAQAVEPTRAVD
ncbi:MFS transporter [Alienimonas californiensis]|uniref:Lysophospholipid transporter LplT n=1 Tax=Alienimonas californiensis TaxID=2527989 RepID=A0A517P3U6_9PLAN|nr:MFS transporter [Alienimonas californiensis]QDT14035.1 Lysophospholipid transporter LplT [Alienimonas californiensis]